MEYTLKAQYIRVNSFVKNQGLSLRTGSPSIMQVVRDLHCCVCDSIKMIGLGVRSGTKKNKICKYAF